MPLGALAARREVALLVDVEAVLALGKPADGASDGDWTVVLQLGERHIAGDTRVSLQDHDSPPLLCHRKQNEDSGNNKEFRGVKRCIKCLPMHVICAWELKGHTIKDIYGLKIGFPYLNIVRSLGRVN